MAKLDILIRADNQTGGAIKQIQTALSGLGNLATATVTAAGVAAVGAVTAVTGAVAVGVGKAAEMEQRTADIASIMGVAFDEAKPLSDLIANLGMDPKLKVNATEAADAIQNLAANGLSMAEILDGAARSTVLLANATGADFGTAANVATDSMALFGIKAADMKAAVDGITGVTVASKFGINDYALALAQGGGVAAAAGVEFDDFNATIAAISPYFAGGSDAGTSFKVMLQRLVPGSKEAEGAMRELGLVTEDGKNQFFDANGQLKSMQEITGLLQTALGGLSEEQKNAALSTIFGSDAMRAAVALADTGSEKFGELKDSLAGVNAEASASTRMDTFSGQLEVLQGIIDGLLLQIGQSFLPLLRDVVAWAINFATVNGPPILAWFQGLADWIARVSPVIQTWAEAFFRALGEIGRAITGAGTDFANLRGLWDALQRKVGEVIAAIIGYVRDHWPTWVAKLAEWGAAAWQWIVDAVPQVMARIKEMLDGLNQWIREHLPQLGPWLDAMGNYWRDVQTRWAENFPKLLADFQGFVDKLETQITRLQDAFRRLFGGGGQRGEIVDSGQRTADALGFVAKSIMDSLTAAFESIVDTVEGLAMLREAFDAMMAGDWNRFSELLNQIGQQAVERRQQDPLGIGWLGEELNRYFEQAWQQQNTTNNNFSVQVQGGGQAGTDVIQAVQLLNSLYQ